ncbi:RHS repeat protein, partial [bacterium]
MVSILLGTPASRADETPSAPEDIFSLAVAALEAEAEEDAIRSESASHPCFRDQLPISPTGTCCENLTAYLNRVCSECLYPTTHPVTGSSDPTCPDKARWTEQRVVEAVCTFIHTFPSCGGSASSCSAIASCVAAFLERPLTVRELAQIEACSGCAFDCSSTNPCGVAPPAECATTPEGLCEQLGEIIQGTRLCQLHCRSLGPTLAPSDPNRDKQEEQELAEAVCAFARQCGYTDMCQVLPCLSRYMTVTPGLLRNLHACVTGTSPTMDMSGMCGTSGCVPSQLIEGSGCFSYADPDGDGRSGTCEDLRLLILVAHQCNDPSGNNANVCGPIDYADLFCRFSHAQFEAHPNGDHSDVDQAFKDLWCARMLGCLAEIAKEFPADTGLQAVLCSLPQLACDSSYGSVMAPCEKSDPLTDGCVGGTDCRTLGPISCDQDGDGDLDCDDITAVIKQALCACDSCTPENKLLCAIDAVCSMLSNCSTMGGDFMVDADLCEGVRHCVTQALGDDLGSSFHDNEQLNDQLMERCQQAMDDFRLRGQVLETCPVKDGCKECPGTPQSGNPVLLETGQKTEVVTDISIALPGGAFNLVRSYASARTQSEWAIQNNGWSGYGWAMSNWLYLEESGDEVIVYGPQAHAQRRFKKDTTVTPYKWRSRGDSNQYVLSTITSSSGTGAVAWGAEINVWRLVDDDGTYWEFYQDNGDNRAKGELFRSITPTGWANYYTYTLLGTDSTTEAPIFRPYAVFLAIPDAPSQSSIASVKVAAKAKVFFDWHLSTTDLVRRGRLRSVEIQRAGAVTDQIFYTYFHHGESTSPALGSDGDLIQVQVSQRLDADAALGGAAMYHRVTQYRYYSDDETYSALDPNGLLRASMSGQAHELKLVIQPEQVEYYAQRTGAGGAAASIFDAVPFAAQHLLTLGDNDAVGFSEDSESVAVVDLAAKLIGYGGSTTTDSRWVTVQYLQSACNCAGSVHGTRQRYFYAPEPVAREYDTAPGYRSAMILEEEATSTTTWTPVREAHSDMVSLYGLNYEVTSATIERLPGGDRGRKWVTHQTYKDLDAAGGPRVVAKVFTPSALSSYTPAFEPNGTDTESPASYTALAAGSDARALVVGYSYTADGYVSETRISNGDAVASGQGAWDISLFKLVSKSYYEDSNHPWLVTKAVRFRDDNVTSATYPSHDRLSTTLFRYGFSSAAATSPVYMVTAIERDAVAENGPRSSSSAPSEPSINSVDFRSYFDGSSDWDASYVLMNDRGQPIWTYSADKVLTYIGRDAVTGQPTRIARNTDGVSTGGAATLTSTWGANVTGISSTLSTSGWCDSTAATVATARGGVLVSTMQYNASGQLVSSTDPSGVSEYVVRTMRESVEQPGLYYLAVAALPHGWTASTHFFEASGRMAIVNAGGRVLQTDELVLSPSATYAPTDGSFTFASLVGRTQSQLGLSGLLKQRKTWHRLDLTDGFGVEHFEYDSAGRILRVTDAAGGITEVSKYDVLGRVLEMQRGDSGGMSLLAKIEYDNESPSFYTIAQGMGNGLVTHEISYPGEGSNREVIRTYDYRGRPVRAENSLSPHSLAVYDNQDNIIESGSFSAVPSSLTMSATNRLGYTKVTYGQRGLPYKVEAALDASASSPSFLTTNSWYDARGRLAATTRPNSPAVKVRRDALGRVIETYLTDGGSDPAPGATDNYTASVAVHGSDTFLAGDIVLEASFNRYAGPSNTWPGRLLQTSSSRRVQDATGTGAITPLTSSDTNYVTTSSAFYYDAAARLSRTAEFGSLASGDILRAGGTLPSWPPSSAPDAGSTTGALVSARTYNDRGLVFSVTDPKGRSSAFVYDHLGRPVVSIDNYVPRSGFGVSWNSTNSRRVVAGLSAADTNRTPSKTYDRAGPVVRQNTHLIPGPGETDRIQVTDYAYG